MKKLGYLALSICICTSFCSASPKIITLPSDGTEKTIVFNAEDPQFIVLSTANSNRTSRVLFGLKSSVEISVEAATRKAKKSVSLASLGTVQSGWLPKGINFFADGKGVSKFRMGGSNSSSTGEDTSRNPDCACLTQSEINELLASNPSYTQTSLCEFLKSQVGTLDCSIFGGSGQGQTTTAQAVGIESRDACDRSNRSVTRFVLKPNVKLSDYPQGIVATISFKNVTYGGEQAASIKPTSDGIWAPEPLFLMSTLGMGWGPAKEFVRVTKWSGNKIRSVVDIKDGISDVYYHGRILHRARAGRGLKLGGRAVVTLQSNAGYVYGHCMSMKRSRQYYGGYHN